MKNILKLIGIIAFVAVIGFLTGCPASDGGSTTGGGKTLTGIAVTTQPTKTVYTIGEQLSTAGMVVTATYSDDTTAAVTTYTTSGFNSSTAGEKNVTVTYEGKTATFTVTVQNPSVGDNQVGGKTFYDYERRVVFAASTGANGTYTGYEVREDDEGHSVLEAGKFLWDEDETGTYTWNEDDKTVILKPEKFRFGRGGILLGKAEYKSAYTAASYNMLEELRESNDWTQEQLNEYINEILASEGYSSIEELIGASTDEKFANRSYTYSFSNDEKSLLMRKHPPLPKGIDELAGQTYHGTTWHWEGEDTVTEEDPNDVYEFSSDKTYKRICYGVEYETGFYSYDSTRTEKRVIFSREKWSMKTAAEYYDTVDVPADNNYIDDDAYKAVQTNFDFRYYINHRYEPTEKLIYY